MLIQAHLAELSIECFDESVACGLAGPADGQLHLVTVSPQIEALRDKLWAIVHADAFGHATLRRHVFQRSHHVIARQPLTHPDRQALTAKVIH